MLSSLSPTSSTSSSSVWKNCHRPSLILSTPQLDDDFYSQPISWGIDQIVITLPQRFVAFPACSPQDFVDMTASDLFDGTSSSSSHHQPSLSIPENVRVFRSALICTTGGAGGGNYNSNSSNSSCSSSTFIDDSLFLGTTSSMIAHCLFTESSIELNRKLRISPLVAPNQFYNPNCYLDLELEIKQQEERRQARLQARRGGKTSFARLGSSEEDEDDAMMTKEEFEKKVRSKYEPLCGITCMSQCGPSRSPCEIVVGTADGIVAIFDIRVPSAFPVLEFGKRPGEQEQHQQKGISNLQQLKKKTSQSNKNKLSAFSTIVNHDHQQEMKSTQSSSSFQNNYNPLERAHPPTTFSKTAVTGLSVDTFGSGMIASGGNDGIVHIWNPCSSSNTGSSYQPVASLTRAPSAVRGLSWCPTKRGLLAVGGGVADCTLSLVDCSAAVSGPDHASQNGHHHFSSETTAKSSYFHQQCPSHHQTVNGGNGGFSLSTVSLVESPSSTGLKNPVSSSSTALSQTSATTKVSIQTGSQISQVLWSNDGNFLVSSHGYEHQSLPTSSNSSGNNNNTQHTLQHGIPAFNLAVWKVKEHNSMQETRGGAASSTTFSLVPHHHQAQAQQNNTGNGNNTNVNNNNNNSSQGSGNHNINNNAVPTTQPHFSPGTRQFLAQLNENHHNASPALQQRFASMRDLTIRMPSSSSSSNQYEREENNNNNIEQQPQLLFRNKSGSGNKFIPNKNSAFSKVNRQTSYNNNSSNDDASDDYDDDQASQTQIGENKNDNDDNTVTSSPAASTGVNGNNAAAALSGHVVALSTPTRRVVSLTQNNTTALLLNNTGASLPRHCPDGWFDIPYRDYHRNNNNNTSLQNTNSNHNNTLLMNNDGQTAIDHHQQQQQNINNANNQNRASLRQLNHNSNGTNQPRFSSLLSASASQGYLSSSSACMLKPSMMNPAAATTSTNNNSTRIDTVAKLTGHTCRPLFLVQRQSILSLTLHKMINDDDNDHNDANGLMSQQKQHSSSSPSVFKLHDAILQLQQKQRNAAHQSGTTSSSSNNNTIQCTGGEFISGAGGLDATVRVWELFDERSSNLSSFLPGATSGSNSRSNGATPVDFQSRLNKKMIEEDKRRQKIMKKKNRRQQQQNDVLCYDDYEDEDLEDEEDENEQPKLVLKKQRTAGLGEEELDGIAHAMLR